jgi:hypothetical protein
MTALKLTQIICLSLAALSGLVLALWIFPRLFFASYSTRIAQSIRLHPIIHVAWGLVGLAVVYLLLKR